MFDIVALGEVLIDFTQSGVSESGMRLFEQNPGGAPANMLTASTRLGMKTAFIGKVGTDMHGTFLKEVLEEQHICTKGMVFDENFFTTLAFVELSETGERKFSFARKPGADTKLRLEEIDKKLLEQTKVFHFGSLSLTDEPCRTATMEAVKYAKEQGAIISYDPNYRELLWESKEQAIEQMRRPIPYVNVLKISDEETELMTGESDPIKASERLVEQGISIVVVTLGEKGALVRTKEGYSIVSGFASKVVDTTGAGDSFWGGFISRIVASGKEINSLTLVELETMIR
ncbi:MAG TPA: hypothetical protein DIT54_05930, partial [Lachnospiraceae bacterium]|nr:hypothetical protein [Lachnospiraceae bacterium]